MRAHPVVASDCGIFVLTSVCPQASLVIRTLLEREGLKYIIVVEHDLSILDYLSDFICVLYGVPSAYGVVTMPFNVRDGAWCFLAEG